MVGLFRDALVHAGSRQKNGAFAEVTLDDLRKASKTK
jgi:hypothetical protein